jgi:hypothetical protein
MPELSRDMVDGGNAQHATGNASCCVRMERE